LDCSIDFDYDETETFEEDLMSPSCLDVRTVYRKEIVEGRIKASPDISKDRFEPDYEFTHKGPTTATKLFKWTTQEQCDFEEIRYGCPKVWPFSALVPAPIGMNEKELGAILSKHKIDISQFGQGEARTLRDFSVELLKGEAKLIEQTDGGIARVVEPVLLKLINSENERVLVQTEVIYPSGTKAERKCLPGTERRPDENVFFAAKRIVRKMLNIAENNVTLDCDCAEFVEDEQNSSAYPGLRTLVRKRIVTARLSR